MLLAAELEYHGDRLRPSRSEDQDVDLAGVLVLCEVRRSHNPRCARAATPGRDRVGRDGARRQDDDTGEQQGARVAAR